MYLCLNKNVKINLNTQVRLESQSFTNPFTMYQTFFTTMDVNLFFLCHQSLYVRLCRHVVELLTVFLLSLFFVINEAPGRVDVPLNLLLVSISKPTCFRRIGYRMPKTIKKQNLNTFKLSCAFYYC